MGVALSRACTVCAAAVLATSSILLEGRLHAPRNNAMMNSKLYKRVCFFMIFSPHNNGILPQVKFWHIPALADNSYKYKSQGSLTFNALLRLFVPHLIFVFQRLNACRSTKPCDFALRHTQSFTDPEFVI
jgi:hypothetical protein